MAIRKKKKLAAKWFVFMVNYLKRSDFTRLRLFYFAWATLILTRSKMRCFLSASLKYMRIHLDEISPWNRLQARFCDSGWCSSEWIFERWKRQHVTHVCMFFGILSCSFQRKWIMHKNHAYMNWMWRMWYDNPLIASYDERGKRDGKLIFHVLIFIW